MKKSLLLLIVALMATTIVKADDVSKEQALLIASQFAATPSAQQQLRRAAPAKPAEPTMAHVMRSKVSGKDNVYIINLGNDQGFVVLSGEDRADDVLLGYCDHGSFSFDNAPVQMKDLLNSYSEQVDELRKTPASSTMTPKRAKADIGSIIIGPLLTTTWNQWVPYNCQCPESPDGYSVTYGGRCATGCYPTAIAQVMNYWKWPKESQGRLFDPVTGKPTGEDFSGHVYDWDNMLDNYGCDYTYTNYDSYNDVQANAVGKLMADIGNAFGTSYGTPTGSPTPFIYDPLIENFGYSPDIQEHRGATASELISPLKAELDQQRPILYSGNSGTDPSGHALVCDGYTNADYFHFNYGWGGSSDGWFKNALVAGFSNNSVIFTGIYPTIAKKTVIDNIEYAFSTTGEAHIKNYNRHSTDDVIVIPDEVTDDDGITYKVTRIWRHAFYSKGHFNKVILGNNVKTIDPFSFINSKIDSLIIGDKVEEIPDAAFRLTDLRYLVIGESIKRIGKQAFMLCHINDVVCSSPAFEVGDEAFMRSGGASINNVDWMRSITKIGYRAFAGSGTFLVMPQFENLEEIGKEAFLNVYFPKDEFYIPAKLKKIDPTAFNGSLKYFIIDKANPYFSTAYKEGENMLRKGILLNKTGTSLIMALKMQMLGTVFPYGAFPETMIKMEPGSISSGDKTNTYSVLIPNTVVEMEGAFKNCELMHNIYCCSAVPPVVSDSTFNDDLVVYDSNKGNPTATLYVPKGSVELYRKAPGWRRFRSIKTLNEASSWLTNDLDYYLAPPHNRQYDMVVHYTDEYGQKSVNVPVGDVDNVKIDESDSKVIISRPGQEDLTISAAQMDSITWNVSSFYDDGEVFNLNDSTLTAVGQYCTVTLGSTVIDEPTQLTIRNAVLTPRMAENMVRGRAVDISLSTGEHELAGTAKIIIPFEKKEGEHLMAVYFNPETGEWEPTYFRYDEEQGAVVILTDHFSIHGVCSLKDINSPKVKIEEYDLCIWDFTSSLKKLYDISMSDNVDQAAIQTFRDDYSFWQTIGLDGGWNALQACGFNSEAIGNACDKVGHLGTFLTVLDVASADLHHDDISVASNTLKAIYGFWSSKAASVIGTSVMQVSMIGVAAIGLLLDKLGTMVQASIKRSISGAYRYYYSDAGVETTRNTTIFKDGNREHDYFGREQKYPHNQYRTKKDWFMYFKPVIEEGKIKPDNFQMLIEQSVRRYCDRFWEDNYLARELCYIWAKSHGMTSVMDAEGKEKLQQQISDEYFVELMNGDITQVFNDLKEYSQEVAEKRVEQAEKEVQKIFNTLLVLDIHDSSVKKGEKSKFAGWKLRFTEIPDNADDPSQWECVIADDGTAKLEFTVYALVKNKIKCSFTLVDNRGIDVKTYQYSIPNRTGKLVQKMDLATGGTEVEVPELKGLELDYNPMTVYNNITMYGTWFTGTPNEKFEERTLFEDVSTDDEKLNGTLFLNNLTNRKARFQTEIEKFFKQHDFIIVDQYGNIQIGDNIVGKFEGDEGKGGFTISTTHPFEEQSIAEYLQHFNEGKDWDRNLLNGTIEHKIDCQFTLTRIPDSEEYAVSYTGQGTYSFKANIIGTIEGVDFDNLFSKQHVIADQIHTREVTQEGSVRLNYTTKLR